MEGILMDNNLYKIFALLAQRVVSNSIIAISLIICLIVIRFLINKFFKDKIARWVMPFLWGLVGVRLVLPAKMEWFSWMDIDIFIKRLFSGNSEYLLFEKMNNSVSTLNDNNFFESISFGVIDYKWMIIFFVVWVSGMMLMLLYCMVGYIRIKKEVSEAVTTKCSNVCLCDRVNQPFILGGLKPVVYMPSIVSSKEFNYILEHEYAHIERRDNIRKFVGYIILCIHWFNPLVWVAYLLFCKDIELACDERAVAHYDVSEKKTYANMLVDWSVGNHAVLAKPLAFGKVGVKERVNALFSNKMNISKAASITICFAATLCLVFNPLNLQASRWIGTVYKTESEVHSSEEIKAAMYEVTGKSGFGVIIDLRYAGDERLKWCCRADGKNEKDVIILNSTIYVSSFDCYSSLESGYHTGWSYMLERTSDGKWEITGEGFEV